MTPKQDFAGVVLAEVVTGEENKNEKNLLLGITLAFAGIFIVTEHEKKP